MIKSSKLHIPELFAAENEVKRLKLEATDLVSWDLTPRQICDLELLMNGGFYPLNGFLGQKDYNSVVENMRMADGNLWPIPINLDVSNIKELDEIYLLLNLSVSVLTTIFAFIILSSSLFLIYS